MESNQNQAENSIGQKVRELRLRKGLSQTELAKLIGCANNTLTEWERRKGRTPGKRFIREVAKALGVTVDYLLGIEKAESPKIPCYGEVPTLEFNWPETNTFFYIEVAPSIYNERQFALKISDEFLQPILYKGDYGIFEKQVHKDGDVVIVRFEDTNKAIIKRWRQENNYVALLESNVFRACSPYFFQIREKIDEFNYLIERELSQCITIVGKLVAVEREVNNIRYEKIMS